MNQPNYPTWFDRVPHPRDVQQSLKYVATLPDQPQYLARADGDAKFALWLRLADQHSAAAIRETGTSAALGGAAFPWHGAYVSCWSPRGAAEAAHAGPPAPVLSELREAERIGRPGSSTAPDPQPGIDPLDTGRER